ncbi:hypothetical protein M5E06_17965 [Azospirillum sp. A1-3]|uniref:hypothetical protein n=1 Tax=Azospirillum sp. A1-3 TaxID=185874 RepID=UPI002076D8E6|nr:hypothetical protein [Azospirillum sp. A1-3]MCM8736023.1 hypothetical protein [Azospirillum sp. A1-3]
MDELWDSITGILSTVAPGIATALGGPLAGAATAAIINALGLPSDAAPAQVADAVKKADPSALLALKQAEQQFQADMRKLDIDVDRLGNEDRANARDRQVKTGDRTPEVLAYGVTLGFFGVLAALMHYGMPDKGGEALLVMLGALGGAWGSVVAYFFGSSSGSKQKTDAMALLAKR